MQYSTAFVSWTYSGLEYYISSCWPVTCLGGVRNNYMHSRSFSASYCLPCFHLLPCLNMKYLCFIYVALFRKKCRKVIYTIQVYFFLLYFYGYLGYPKPVTCIHMCDHKPFKRKYILECFIRNIHCSICIILFLKSFIHVSVGRRVKIQCVITSSSVQVCCMTSSRAHVTTPA